MNKNRDDFLKRINFIVASEKDNEQDDLVVETFEKKPNKSKGLDVPKFGNTNSKPKKYEGTKSQVRKAKSKGLSKRARRRLSLALLTLATAGGISYGVISNIRESHSPITLDEAIQEEGLSAKNLELTSDDVQKIEELQEKLEAADSEIDLDELKEIGEDLFKVQGNVLKSKVAAELGIKDINKVEAWSRLVDTYEDNVETIEISSRHLKIKDDQMPKAVENYIKSFANTQKTNATLESGEFDKNNILKTYRKTLKEVSQFAAGDLTITTSKDDFGNTKVENIEFEQTKQKDLEHKTTQKEQDDYER